MHHFLFMGVLLHPRIFLLQPCNLLIFVSALVSGSSKAAGDGVAFFFVLFCSPDFADLVPDCTAVRHANPAHN